MNTNKYMIRIQKNWSQNHNKALHIKPVRVIYGMYRHAFNISNPET